MTKLSIIVPIYNVEQYLQKCVDSLLAQDLPSSEYEIILVDDESPDACSQMCDKYAAVHENIRVIHRENGGLSAARNSGVEIAQGECLMFVDSDDYIEPNVLNGLLAQMERDNLEVLRYRLQYVNPQYEVFNPYKKDPFRGNDYSEEPTDGVTFLNTRMNTACYAWQFILRRGLIVKSLTPSLFNSLNTVFTPGIYFEDTDWTPRMLVRAKSVASTEKIVYNYMMREGSITNAVNRGKQKKVLDDKMRLVAEMKKQSRALQEQGKDNRWFAGMIADTVISIMGILSTQFYDERKNYLAQLRELEVYPIQSPKAKARLINFSPRLVVELLHIKNS